ncbi:MAG: alpha/beta fold hydrolase [Pseudomonadota bacterium]
MMRASTVIGLPVIAALVLLVGCASQGNNAFDPISMDVQQLDPAFPPANVELSFMSGGERLPAYLMLANGKGPHPTVVLLHGYPGNEKNLDLAQSLRRTGFNVMFFHYRGAWGAEGEYTIANLSRDAAAAVQFLRTKADDYRVDRLRLGLVGHSMGGFTALRTAARDARLDCVVGLAAANIGEYADAPQKDMDDFAGYSDTLFMLNGLTGRKIVREIRTNGREYNLLNDVQGMSGKSVLLITGSSDESVPVDVQRRLAEAYRQNPRIRVTALEIPGDHSFSAQRIAMQKIVLNWMVANCG